MPISTRGVAKVNLFESLDFRLGIVPPALNRKSISPLLTAARREKLLISAADLCKCPICLRSTCPFDLNSQLCIVPLLLLSAAESRLLCFFRRGIQSAAKCFDQQAACMD